MSTATFPGTRKQSLRERVAGGASRVDAEAGIIRDVKVLGYTSKNGRTYTRAALEGAIGMYEAVAVNVDHDTASRFGRSVSDRIGWLQGVHLASDGLRGDLHLLLSDPRAAKVLEVAQRNPSLLGLSHDAWGRVREDRATGRVVVEEIERVVSVDLVADPATTSGLFEGVVCSTYERVRDAVRSGRPLSPEEERLLEEAATFDPVAGRGREDDEPPLADTMKQVADGAVRDVLAHKVGELFMDETLTLAEIAAKVKDLLDEFEANAISTADTAESLSYEALRDSLRPRGRAADRQSDGRHDPDSYEALREQIRPRR